MKKFILSVLTFALVASTSFAGFKLNGAGASFPYPVYSAWAFTYYKDTGNQINYQSIGSGGGIRQITARTVDFGGTDKPLTPAELKEADLLQFPAVIGGVVPIVNIKGVKSGELKLSPEVLADIFMGRIEKWSDPRIQKLNEGIKLPNKAINVVHRSDGSGTTAIFTTYLSEVSPVWKDKVGAGKAVKWPKGRGGKKNDGVANYVQRLNNSIGYVEFAFAKNNKIPYAKLSNKAGNYVDPSFETFKEAAAYAEWKQDEGYYLWLVNSPGEKSWPIAGATFILMAKEKPEVNKKVVTFFDWCFNNGDKMAEKLIYVPLPESLKNNIRDYWKKNGLY